MGVCSVSTIKSVFLSGEIWPYLIPALILVAYAVYKLVAGDGADKNPVAALLATLPKDEYTVLSDIMIRSYTGASHIDHIVISTHGVFVIHAQKYHGEIAGKDTDQYWTWSQGKEKHRFFNPIRQNYSHIKALETALEAAGKVPLISVVVFPRDCSFKSKPLGVLHYDELLAKIQSYSKNALTRTQTEVIAAILERANISSPEERKHYAGLG